MTPCFQAPLATLSGHRPACSKLAAERDSREVNRILSLVLLANAATFGLLGLPYMAIPVAILAVMAGGASVTSAMRFNKIIRAM